MAVGYVHFSIKSLLGVKIHVSLVTRNLQDYLSSCNLGPILSLPCSESLFTELINLDCYWCHLSCVCEDEEDEPPILNKEKKVLTNFSVVFYILASDYMFLLLSRLPILFRFFRLRVCCMKIVMVYRRLFVKLAETVGSLIVFEIVLVVLL